MEFTYIVIKPNADDRAEEIMGELPCEIEPLAYHVSLPPEFWRSFYVAHRGKSFFEALVEFMSSGTTTHLVGYGEGVIKKVRDAIGSTDPAKAAPHTIRARYGKSITENAIHASDGETSARFELSCGLAGLLDHGHISLRRFMELKDKFLKEEREE